MVLPERRHRLRVPRIEPLPAGKRLRVPLLCSPGGTPEAVVHLGQSVNALDLLSRSGEPPLCTYAPASGTVTAVGRVPTTSGRVCLAVELALAGDQPAPAEQPCPPPPTPSSLPGWAAFCDRFGLINTIDGQPLSGAFRQAAHRPIDHLIIRALGSEPLETAAPALLLEQGTTVIETAERLADALGAPRTWLALTRHFPQGQRLLARIARHSSVSPIALPDRYPQANVHLLTRSICGRVVPVGESPERHGVCVVGVAALATLAQATLYALPRTTCVLTVTGDAVTRPADYRLPVGMTVGELLERVGTTKPTGPVIAGGPLSGRSLPHPDVVIDGGTSCLTVLSRRRGRRPGPQACLRCGRCLDACPTGLNPAALMNLTEQFAYDRAADLHPEACLECGICSYVCPAHLDLARAVGQLKQARPAAAEVTP